MLYNNIILAKVYKWTFNAGYADAFDDDPRLPMEQCKATSSNLGTKCRDSSAPEDVATTKAAKLTGTAAAACQLHRIHLQA